MPHVPENFDRYIEPFLGGGSVFLALAPERALLNDACVPLADTWRSIQANPAGVYREATRRSLDSETYYSTRAERGGGHLQRAGRFLYLNKGAFNGLYRVNLKGEFNVPWGAPKTDFVASLDNLNGVSALLNKESVLISDGDFEDVITKAQTGDFVFVDPPYVTSHNENGFIAYNEKIFSWDDQIRLAASVHDAITRGATVLVTNANHVSVRNLYPNLDAVVLDRASTLAASVKKRGRVSEILLIGGPAPASK